MDLNQVLARLSVGVEPFAICTVRAGWRLRLPPPPDAMLHFVLEGTGSVRGGPNDPPVPIYPYCLAVVPQQSPHALECGTPVTNETVIETVPESASVHQIEAGSGTGAALLIACGLVHASYGDALGLFGRLPGLVVADLSHYPQVRGAFEGIMAEQQSNEAGSSTLARALMSQCLVYLLRRLEQDASADLPWLAMFDDPALGLALDAMLEHPEVGHTVESLAAEASMSRSAFASHFHDAFGQPPLTVLHAIRMQRAADLLRRDRQLPIARVARQVGFHSRSRFSEAFKERYGMTPAVYRATAP